MRREARVVGRSAAGAAVGVEKTVGEGPKNMELSIVEIFTALERTKGCAHAWAQSQPKHDEALGKFIKDLDQIGLELQKSVLVKPRSRSAKHGRTVGGNLHDCLTPYTLAVAFADLISERQPEYTVPLKRFREELQRVQQEMIKKVYPGVFSNES